MLQFAAAATVVGLLLAWWRAPALIDRVLTVGRAGKRALVHADLLPHIPDAGVLVDVGSGDGHVGDLIQAARPGLTIVSLDTADVHEAGREPLLFDGKALPLASASADVVLLCLVLHHAAAPEPLLRDAARVLRPGGHILVVEEAVETVVDTILTRIHGWAAQGRCEFRTVAGWAHLLAAETGLCVEAAAVSPSPVLLYPVTRRLFYLA